MNVITVIERMKTSKNKGAPCRACRTLAVDCQVIFLESDLKQWCCPTCREHGPRSLHTEEGGP